MKKGIFCISIDTELLWGRKDLDYSKFIRATKKERDIINRLLDIFTKYKISVTWAVVGSMNSSGDPLWRGKDIIDQIKKTKLQEVGSHSYSHEVFTQIDKDCADQEVKRNRAVSFVFPRNKVAHLDLLKKYGFKIYRSADQTNWETIIPRIPPVYELQTNKGLIATRGSMYFVSARGIRKYIPIWLRVVKAKLGIKSAVKNRKVFHLWFHPVDLAENTIAMLDGIEQIVKYANEKREQGLLEIKSMEQTASEFGFK
ncbi:MAG: polysaccharide deacetylase family protein [Patescibacteria group bacterium]